MDWLRSFPSPPYFWGAVIQAIVGCNFQLLLLTALFCFCCDLPLLQQIYGAICAILSENLAYVLFLVIYPQGGHRVINPSMAHPWIEILIVAGVYALLYFFLAVKLPKDKEYRFRCGLRSVVLFLMLLLLRSVGVYAKLLHQKPEFYRVILFYSAIVYVALAGLQLLSGKVREWRNKAAVESLLRHNLQREHRELLSSTDTLRHAGHEMKHILAAIPLENEQHEAYARELEEALKNYEAHMDTGNDTLDAMLPITWKRCHENGVKWTCIADGSVLNGMDPVDIFILMGNALDNALESAVQEEDPEKRFMSLTIWRQSGMALIRLENSCPNEPAFVGSFPVTAKAGPDHGYGVRSIRRMSMTARDQVFTLSIALPIY